MKKPGIIAILILTILAAVALTIVPRALKSVALVMDLSQSSDEPWDKTPFDIEEQEISFGYHGVPNADLYLAANGKKRAGLLLIHGLTDLGKNDPALVKAAHALAKAGFAVLVPELEGLKDFRVGAEEIDGIVYSFEKLLKLDTVDQRRCGIMAFSYAVGPAIIAASEPSVRDRVKFVFSFGGYYDLMNVIRFITTGEHEHGGEVYRRQPKEVSKWYFLYVNAHFLEGSQGKLLRETALAKIFKKEDQVSRLAAEMNPESRAVWELVMNDDPQAFKTLIGLLPASIVGPIKKLSLVGREKELRARLIIGHGRTDDLIPFTESLKMAEAYRSHVPVHLEVLSLFSHIDSDSSEVDFITFIKSHILEFWRTFSLAFDLLGQ